VIVQPFGSKARVRPGGTATYIIWVWSTHASARRVIVSAAVHHLKGVGVPRFSVCPNASRATCALGNLPRGQADELKARVAVRKAAIPGRHVRLTAEAKAKGAISFSADASVRIAARHLPSASPPPSTSSVPPLPPLPPVTNPSGSGTNPAGLFPTVSPRPSDGQSPGFPATGHRNSRAIRATSISDTLPLNPRLIGGQLAGLVVLAAAITIAIARLSLRPQRPQDGKGTSDTQ